MKVCIVGWYHHKNLPFLHRAFQILGWQEVSFSAAQIVFDGSQYIPIHNFPEKKFICGPHFSVFPDGNSNFDNRHHNAIYIHPSQFCVDIWAKELNYRALPVRVFAFGVDTDRFNSGTDPKTEVFVYHKRRKPEELKLITDFLTEKNIKYHLFDYVKHYEEEDYLSVLKRAKYGIWLGTHESQGFGLEEALSCNVPLLVWNVTRMSQEAGQEQTYAHIKTPATTIAYWSENCGEFFYQAEEFLPTYDKFIAKLEQYTPRQYILDNLSMEKRAQALLQLCENM